MLQSIHSGIEQLCAIEILAYPSHLILSQPPELEIVWTTKISGFYLRRLRKMKNPLSSPPNPGGSQIQDREWEKWRDVLIHLYLEDGVKLKDIVRIMAEEYKFVVT